MKNLYYIRHGETDTNKNRTWSEFNTPLNSTGYKQAQKVAQELKDSDIKIDLIITSTQPRSYETANIIANAINYPKDKIIRKQEIIERRCGVLEGTKNLQASMEYKEDEVLIEKYQGVEKLVDMEKRASNFYEQVKNLDEDTVLVVGHSAFGRAFKRKIDNRQYKERDESLENAKLYKLI